MKWLKAMFGRQALDAGISRELDERERVVREQERRLSQINRLRREREMYRRRKESPS